MVACQLPPVQAVSTGNGIPGMQPIFPMRAARWSAVLPSAPAAFTSMEGCCSSSRATVRSSSSRASSTQRSRPIHVESVNADGSALQLVMRHDTAALQNICGLKGPSGKPSFSTNVR